METSVARYGMQRLYHRSGVALAVATLASPPSAAGSAPPTSDVARGKQLFAQNCAVCHGPHGEGSEGPSLKNEASRAQDVADVAAYVDSLK